MSHISSLGTTGSSSESSVSDLGLQDFWPVFFLSISLLSTCFATIFIFCSHFRYKRHLIEQIAEGFEEENLNEEGEKDGDWWKRMAETPTAERFVVEKKMNFRLFVGVFTIILLSVVILTAVLMVDRYSTASSSLAIDTLESTDGATSTTFNYGLLNRNDCWMSSHSPSSLSSTYAPHLSRCLIVKMSGVSSFVLLLSSNILLVLLSIVMAKSVNFHTESHCYTWKSSILQTSLAFLSSSYLIAFTTIWGLSGHWTIRNNMDYASLDFSYVLVCVLSVVVFLTCFPIKIVMINQDLKDVNEKMAMLNPIQIVGGEGREIELEKVRCVYGQLPANMRKNRRNGGDSVDDVDLISKMNLVVPNGDEYRPPTASLPTPPLGIILRPAKIDNELGMGEMEEPGADDDSEWESKSGRTKKDKRRDIGQDELEEKLI